MENLNAVIIVYCSPQQSSAFTAAQCVESRAITYANDGERFK